MFATNNALLEIYVGRRCHSRCKHKIFLQNCYLCQMYITCLVSYILSQTYAKLWHFQRQLTTNTKIKLIFHFRPISPCPLIIAYLNIEFLFFNVVDSINLPAALTNWIFWIEHDNLYPAGWFISSTTSTNKNSIHIFILTLNSFCEI